VTEVVDFRELREGETGSLAAAATRANERKEANSLSLSLSRAWQPRVKSPIPSRLGPTYGKSTASNRGKGDKDEVRSFWYEYAAVRYS